MLSPRSIAVVGASATQGKVGHDILSNLLIQGYKGRVFAINPKATAILGCPAFPSMASLPEPAEMAVIAIPAAGVPQILRECAAAGTKNIVIITAGFKETGKEEGAALESEVRRIAEEHALSIIGPNCLGILRPSIGLNASFAKNVPPVGNVALISQSGSTAVAIMDQSPHLGFGFSTVLSIGNKTVLSEIEYLRICADDPETQVIALYLESLENGRAFLEEAARVAKHKPVVLIRAGTTDQGRRAAQSHTGALASGDRGLEGLCAQHGVTLAHNMEEFIDAITVLSMQPALLTRRIAVVTNAGGLGILATDAASLLSLRLPELRPEGCAALKEVLPETASVKNPIDIIGDAKTDRYEAAIGACRDDPNIDGIVVLLSPQIMTPCSEIADAVIRETRHSSMIPVTTCFMGGDVVHEAHVKLRKAGIPTFATPERAVRAMRMLLPLEPKPRGTPSAKTTAPSLQGKTGLLNEADTAALFDTFGLPLPRQELAASRAEAASAMTRMPRGVAMKISSKDILHKTDVGGVRVGIHTQEEAEQAYDDIMTNIKTNAPHAAVNGILMQELLPPGEEFIIGGVHDPSFGPMVMVGLGGIYAELFKDTSFRLAPLTKEDAYDMLDDLKSWKLLLGMRGKAQADIDALAELIVKVSDLLTACPDIVELDCNPAIIRSDGITIADAKVVLRPKSH